MKDFILLSLKFFFVLILFIIISNEASGQTFSFFQSFYGILFYSESNNIFSFGAFEKSNFIIKLNKENIVFHSLSIL